MPIRGTGEGSGYFNQSGNGSLSLRSADGHNRLAFIKDIYVIQFEGNS